MSFLKHFSLFFTEDQLGAAKAKLVELQEAAKLAELKAYEARKEVEAAEFKIEFIKRKGHVEEIFWRFPHIGEKIFDQLDSESLGEFIQNVYLVQLIEHPILQNPNITNYIGIFGCILLLI